MPDHPIKYYLARILSWSPACTEAGLETLSEFAEKIIKEEGHSEKSIFNRLRLFSVDNAYSGDRALAALVFREQPFVAQIIEEYYFSNEDDDFFRLFHGDRWPDLTTQQIKKLAWQGSRERVEFILKFFGQHARYHPRKNFYTWTQGPVGRGHFALIANGRECLKTSVLRGLHARPKYKDLIKEYENQKNL